MGRAAGRDRLWVARPLEAPCLLPHCCPRGAGSSRARCLGGLCCPACSPLPTGCSGETSSQATLSQDPWVSHLQWAHLRTGGPLPGRTLFCTSNHFLRLPPSSCTEACLLRGLRPTGALRSCHGACWPGSPSLWFARCFRHHAPCPPQQQQRGRRLERPWGRYAYRSGMLSPAQAAVLGGGALGRLGRWCPGEMVLLGVRAPPNSEAKVRDTR